MLTERTADADGTLMARAAASMAANGVAEQLWTFIRSYDRTLDHNENCARQVEG